jgi:putative transposase
MPRKTRNQMPADAGLPDIPKEFLDQFLTGPMAAEGVEAIMAKLKKAVIERALGAEMSHHLGYAPGPGGYQRAYLAERHRA